MIQWTSNDSPSLPFSLFGDLVRKISTNSKRPELVFNDWVKHLPFPLPSGTGASLFRFLFPDVSPRRKYGMREHTLGKHIADIFQVNFNTRKHLPESHENISPSLSDWNSEEHSGCLGNEVFELITRSSPTIIENSKLSFDQVDVLLDQLAAHCPFSQISKIKIALPTQHEILTKLFTNLSPGDASIMTQIILRDIRPNLYPIDHTMSTTRLLLRYNSRSRPVLTLDMAMDCWHWALEPVYRVHNIFEFACRAVETISRDTLARDKISTLKSIAKPAVFSPIQIPKALKGQGCEQATRQFNGIVYAETKYDGQRVQIHLDMSVPDPNERIKLFSKSGRVSTNDLRGIHSIIMASLGLPFDKTAHNGVLRERNVNNTPISKGEIKNIILEAEVVPWNESSHLIDEFYHLTSFRKLPRSECQRESLNTPKKLIRQDTSSDLEEEEPWRHLMIVFFDILLLNDVYKLYTWYSVRRTLLEEVIHIIPGFSMLSERKLLDFGYQVKGEDIGKLKTKEEWEEEEKQREKRSQALQGLREYFAKVISDRQEGIMLKAEHATYNQKTANHKWVKLKRDYINGLGDCADFVIVACGWDKDRARELRVGPKVVTTWYAAAAIPQDNQDTNEKIRYKILFPVFYGLSRTTIEHANAYIANDKVGYDDYIKDPTQLEYLVDLPKRYRPAYFLKKPLVFEIFGDRFTKNDEESPYTLRFPRISKWHFDRLPEDALTLESLEKVALEAVSLVALNGEEDVSTIWFEAGLIPESQRSPKKNCHKTWIQRLSESDGLSSSPNASNYFSDTGMKKRKRSKSCSHALVIPAKASPTEAKMLTEFIKDKKRRMAIDNSPNKDNDQKKVEKTFMYSPNKSPLVTPTKPKPKTISPSNNASSILRTPAKTARESSPLSTKKTVTPQSLSPIKLPSSRTSSTSPSSESSNLSPSSENSSTTTPSISSSSVKKSVETFKEAKTNTTPSKIFHSFRARRPSSPLPSPKHVEMIDSDDESIHSSSSISW